MDLIILFLNEDILPEEKLEAKNVRRKASRFWLSKDPTLYKCSFSGPYLLCIHPKTSELLLKKLHERDLWKPHWRHIFILLSHHSRLLVAKHAEKGTRVCKEV